MPLLHLHDPVVDELGKSTTDRLELQAKITAYFFARHPEHQFGLRESARVQPLNQIEQEGGQPLFGAHAAEQQHDTVLPDNFPAHDLVYMALQCVHLGRQLLNAVEGHHTDLSVFQGNRVATVAVADDAVESHDFPSHLKAGYLIAPILRCDAGLEEAGADRVQAGESVALAKQLGAPLDPAPARDQPVDLLQFFGAQAQRHAQFAQVAV